MIKTKASIKDVSAYESLASYDKRELEAFAYWQFFAHFILIDPRKVNTIVPYFDIYALNIDDGSDFLIESKEELTEIAINRGEYMLAISK